MAKRPAVPIAISFAAGILLAGAGVQASAIAIVLLAISLIAATAVRRSQPWLLLLLTLIAVGWIRYTTYVSAAGDDISKFASKHVDGFWGLVVSDPDIRENRTYAVVRTSAVSRWEQVLPASGNVMLTVYSPARQQLEYGQRVFVHSGVWRPMLARNPGSFSWADYLARQRIYAAASVRSDEDLSILPGKGGNRLVSGSLTVKRWIDDATGQLLPGTEARFVRSILLGNYALLPDELISAFSRSGTLHLLAAFGFNCLVLINVFGAVLRRVLTTSRGRQAAVLTSLLLVYMLMIGAKPSIVRATVMASLVLLAYPLKRVADGPNLLFGAALIILALRPTDLFDVGFQLSFVAAGAIITILPALNSFIAAADLAPAPAKAGRDVDRAKNWAFRNLVLGGTTTIAATLGTAPLIAHYFNYVSIVSPVANVTVAAAIEPIFCLGLSAPMVAQVPILSELVGLTATWFCKATLGAVSYFGELRWAAISLPSPGLLVICGYYLLLWTVISYASSRLARR